MPSTPYHGGHPLADILQDWGGRSLVWQQEHLAGMIERGEIVITPELPEGWSLESAPEYMRSIGHYGPIGSGRRRGIVIATPSEWYDPANYRCHFPRIKPEPPAPPPSFEKQMIERLVERLKRHQARGYTRAKAFYRKLFKRVFNLSANKFDEKVWPEATKAPGVETPQAGAPPKKK
jgi:hypothetical protein